MGCFERNVSVCSTPCYQITQQVKGTMRDRDTGTMGSQRGVTQNDCSVGSRT